MAVTQTPYKQTVSLKLNNGTTATGSVKTVSVSLGTLKEDPASFDAQKAMNIINLLAECLEKTLYRAEYSVIKALEEE